METELFWGELVTDIGGQFIKSHVGLVLQDPVVRATRHLDAL
jgi:hypothetical protein